MIYSWLEGGGGYLTPFPTKQFTSNCTISPRANGVKGYHTLFDYLNQDKYLPKCKVIRYHVKDWSSSLCAGESRGRLVSIKHVISLSYVYTLRFVV